jgi:AcrR family transcriptional regulator
LEAEKVGEGSAAHRASLAADALVGRAPGKQLALEVRRMWAIAAAARIAHELGVEEVRLATVARRAGIGEDALSALFADREELLAAAFGTACILAAERAIPHYMIEVGPVQRLRAGVAQLLAFHDAEPELSSICLNEAPELATQRAGVRRLLARVICEELDTCFPPAVSPGEIEMAVARALEVVRRARGETPAGRAEALLAAVMQEILTPHLGTATAQIEASLPAPEVLTTPRRLYADGRAGLDVRLTAHLLGSRSKRLSRPLDGSDGRQPR